MKQIDSLIHARWVITVNKKDDVLENHSIAIHSGKIIDIIPTEKAKAKYQTQEESNLNTHAVLPGLINAHAHSAMSLLRGIADDKALMDWLENHIWPAEGRCVNEQFVADGTQLAIAEMIKSGTTTFADMYFFPNIVAREAREAGIRASVGIILIDFPTVWAADADEYIAKGVALHDEYRNDPLVNTIFAPHAPYTVSDGPLEKINALAAEMDISIQMHVHETADEVNMALEASGSRPLSRLNELGLLGPDFMAVHMTQLTDEEISLLAKQNVSVVHCPESNMKLASGICPVNTLISKKVNVALGTDGAASNNDLDMLGEMRSAAFLGKVSTMDATALSASTVLRMATINGAKALHIDDLTGSIEKNKAADITAIDLDHISTQPVYDPVSQIVYAASREQVSHVWVNGKCLLNNKNLTGFNEENLINMAKQWHDTVTQDDK